MGNTAFSAISSESPSFFQKAKKNTLWSKHKQKWKRINFITIEENFHFTVNNTSIKQNEDENSLITPKGLPRYEYDVPQNALQPLLTSNIVHHFSLWYFQSAESPRHMPVVLTAAALLQGLDYKEYLPLGIVLNVLFQNDKWLYVRTAHGHEGYVCSDICLPLEIPRDSQPIQNHYTNTLETLKLIYEEDVTGEINYSERNVDLLSLQATGIRQKQNMSRLEPKNYYGKSTKLIVKNDYNSGETNTLSVKKGDVVRLVHYRIRGWFWVRNEQNEEGFIPAAVAGYRCF